MPQTISNILRQIPCQLLAYCSYVRVLWSNYRRYKKRVFRKDLLRLTPFIRFNWVCSFCQNIFSYKHSFSRSLRKRKLVKFLMFIVVDTLTETEKISQLSVTIRLLSGKRTRGTVLCARVFRTVTVILRAFFLSFFNVVLNFVSSLIFHAIGAGQIISEENKA